MHDDAIDVLDRLALEDEESLDVWYLLGWTNFLKGGDHLGNAKFYVRKAKKVGDLHPRSHRSVKFGYNRSFVFGTEVSSRSSMHSSEDLILRNVVKIEVFCWR